jgi:hypothetical protein
MVEILIRDGDTVAAAKELSSALREIVAVDPVQTTIANERRPDTRALLEVAAICLAFPPALIGAAGIVTRMKLGDRLQRLLSKATTVRKTTRANILIDLGHGKPVPLEEASRAAILTALQAVEQRLRS